MKILLEVLFKSLLVFYAIFALNSYAEANYWLMSINIVAFFLVTGFLIFIKWPTRLD